MRSLCPSVALATGRLASLLMRLHQAPGVRDGRASTNFEPGETMPEAPYDHRFRTGSLCARRQRQRTNAADVVQRDVNQQNRIEQGLTSGQLTTRKAGKLEREQGRVKATCRRGEAAHRARGEQGQQGYLPGQAQRPNRESGFRVADGHVGAVEQNNMRAAENRQSRRIRREKHNSRKRDGACGRFR
jgi:hypothetical protein